ncbi:MAG: hypothetical protein RLZZ273_371 [Bacteroidota bacterium]
MSVDTHTFGVHVRFVLSRKFIAKLHVLFDSSTFEELVEYLTLHPLNGSVIRGLNGVRKMRFADKLHGIGKQGGLRIIYSYEPSRRLVIIYIAYRKRDQSDLLPHQRDYIQSFSHIDIAESFQWHSAQ